MTTMTGLEDYRNCMLRFRAGADPEVVKARRGEAVNPKRGRSLVQGNLATSSTEPILKPREPLWSPRSANLQVLDRARQARAVQM